MNGKIRNMFLQDCTIIFSVTIVLWVTLLFVIRYGTGIASNATIAWVIAAAGTTAGVFATTAAVAVFLHLWKNKIKLYTAELSFSEGEK